MAEQELNWSEASVRGVRTFFQTFASSFSVIQAIDTMSKKTVIEIGLKFAAATLSATLAGMAAFAQNLGGLPLPTKHVERVKKVLKRKR